MRCSNSDRPEARECATSAGRRVSWAVTKSCRRAACPRSDWALCALMTQASGAAPGPAVMPGGAAGALGCSGASSRTTWAFVPPMPNEDTPDLRG